MYEKRDRKPFTFEEMQDLENYAKSDLSCASIARYMKRGTSSIVHHYKLRGGRENYTAHNAKKMADEGKERTIEKRLKTTITKRGGGKTNKEEIQSIKMQLEIIFDLIKELREKINDYPIKL